MCVLEAPTHENDEWRHTHVQRHEVGLGEESRVELHDVVEVVEVVLDAVDVGHDDQLGEADEEVGPPGGVVVEQVQEIPAALKERVFRMM